MKHQLGRASQADRKSCSTHQNARNACKKPAEGVSLLMMNAGCQELYSQEGGDSVFCLTTKT